MREAQAEPPVALAVTFGTARSEASAARAMAAAARSRRLPVVSRVRAEAAMPAAACEAVVAAQAAPFA